MRALAPALGRLAIDDPLPLVGMPGYRCSPASPASPAPAAAARTIHGDPAEAVLGA